MIPEVVDEFQEADASDMEMTDQDGEYPSDAVN